VNKKFVLTAFIFIFFSSLLIAQTKQAWWYTLEQGKFHFRAGSLGNALVAFDDARRGRIEHFTILEQNFIAFLSAPEIRRLGDSLERIEFYITERNRSDAADILSQLYYYVPKTTLGDSVTKALNEFDRLKNYPEAEYWLGEAYRTEGELNLALRQYKKAYENKELLVTPGFEIEILYKMAFIHQLKREYQEMENRLLEILKTGVLLSAGRMNFYWYANAEGPVVTMFRILENDGINRFISLYRSDDSRIERAHRILGTFYYTTSRHSTAAEHLMFAFLIHNSVIIEEIIRNEFDFTFTSLDTLPEWINRYSILGEFTETVEYYKTVYYLACALFATGKRTPAQGMWTFIGTYAPAGEWQNRARAQLRQPRVDPAVEMP